MIRLIAKREFISNIMTFRFGAGMILCVLLTVLCMPILIEEFEERLEDYNTALQKHTDELKEVETFSFLKPMIDRPPTVLSIFNEGIEKQLASSVLISSGNVPITLPSDGVMDPISMFISDDTMEGGRSNELLTAFPSIDIITIIKVVMGLLALLFAFDAVVGEREQGTLRMELANSVPRDKLLLGKFIGGIGGLILPLTVTFLLIIIMMQLSPSIVLRGSDIARVGLIFLSSLLYVVVLFLLGLLISCMVRSARVSLLLCLFSWTFLVVIIPDLSASLSQQLISIPSDDEREMQAKEIEKLYNRNMSEFRQKYEPKKYFYTRSWQDPGINARLRFEYTFPERMMYHARRVAFAEPLRRTYAEQIGQVREKQTLPLAEQVRWSRRIGIISPAIVYDIVTGSLCGTDWGAYERFISDARRYRLQVLDYIRDNGGMSFRFFTNVSLSKYLEIAKKYNPEDLKFLYEPDNAPLLDFLTDMEGKSKTLDLSGFPWFEYRQEDLSAVIRRTMVGIGFLIMYGIVLFGVTYGAFVRYDPR